MYRIIYEMIACINFLMFFVDSARLDRHHVIVIRIRNGQTDRHGKREQGTVKGKWIHYDMQISSSLAKNNETLKKKIHVKVLWYFSINFSKVLTS